MKMKMNGLDSAVFVAALLAATGLLADTKEWNGGASGDWNAAENWLPIGVPSSADDVTISSGTVLAVDAIDVASLDIGASATLFFGSTGTVAKAYATYPEAPAQRTFRVAGDLSCAGGLAVGGLWTVADKDIITNLSVSIGGDFRLTDAAKAAFYAATTPDLFSWDNLYAARTTVAVGGALSVADTAVLYSTCDELTGAPLCFTCATFSLGASAQVNAVERGWAWFKYSIAADRDLRKTGDSAGYFTLARHQIGNDWGGHGQYGAEANAYGYPYAPFMAGAPSSTRGPYPGGGQVWIVAADTATVEGQILADATSAVYGPGSGGGIWLCARKITAGPDALLSASGARNSHSSATGGGTGGRISVGLGLSATEIDALAHGQTPADLGLASLETINEIPFSAAGNRGGAKDANGNYKYSLDGTATAVYGSLADTAVTVFDNHEGIGNPEPGFGPGAYAKASIQTFSCKGYGYASPTERFSCIGYVVSNATAEITRGTTDEVELTIGADPLSVTWLWGEREVAYSVVGVEGAQVSINGESAAEDVTVWQSAGARPVVGVTPEDGYEFICWEGPVPYGQATANPVTLPADVARSLKPIVREAAEPITRTYNVSNAKTTKSWTDPTAWTPAGIPGADDHIILAGKGTLLASNYFACASLTLKDAVVFKVANTASSLLEEAALVVKGDLTMTNTASLTVAPRNETRRGHIEVGGNLSLTGSGTLTVSAGPTDEGDFTSANGAGFVNVGGDFLVGGSSTVIPNSEPWTGGSVVFTVGGDFVLTTNAAFKANANGFQRKKNYLPVTLGPGWGLSYTIGAGYGGYGVANNATYGKTYGFDLAPVMPGSPAGDYADHPGGGLIRVHAKGRADLAGRLDAAATASDTGASSASGGGVWVTAEKRISVRPGATLKARGGYKCTGVGVAGGGGRIALIQFATPAMVARMAETGEYAGPGNASRHVLDKDAFLEQNPGVAVDVLGGGGLGAPNEGTLRFIDAEIAKLLIIVR